MTNFSKTDFCDLSKYCNHALEHLIDFDMPIGSPLYTVFCLLKVCKEISDFNS